MRDRLEISLYWAEATEKWPRSLPELGDTPLANISTATQQVHNFASLKCVPIPLANSLSPEFAGASFDVIRGNLRFEVVLCRLNCGMWLK